VNKLLGKDNMVSLDGPKWKMLRSIFNPGFSASHLMSLVPYMLDLTLIFVNACREKAQTNELFQLDKVATRYAIDIIGKVAMDTDFNSQIRPHPIVETFRRQITLLPTTSIGPFDDLNVLRPFQLWWNTRKLNSLIGKEVDREIDARTSTAQAQTNGHANKSVSFKERRRSILDLALDAYEKENPASATQKTAFSAAFRRTLVDSLKTFIFAGHDTTSATISYTMYLLHLHPNVYKRVAEEIDSVFGTDCTPEQIAAGIRSQPHSINKLEYLNAVIKETLRLFPPASTLRALSDEDGSSKNVFITDPKSGRSYPIRGFDAWPIAHMIHRNEAYFPEPVKFIPERFLQSETPFPDAKLFTPAGKDAWRPFEKGPRNCIGQELAMMESRILLACVVKEVDFTAEYDGKKIDSWTPIETVDEYADGIPGTKRRTIEGHAAYQVLSGAANPAGAMPGRLRLRSTI